MADKDRRRPPSDTPGPGAGSRRVTVTARRPNDRWLEVVPHTPDHDRYFARIPGWSVVEDLHARAVTDALRDVSLHVPNVGDYVSAGRDLLGRGGAVLGRLGRATEHQREGGLSDPLEGRPKAPGTRLDVGDQLRPSHDLRDHASGAQSNPGVVPGTTRSEESTDSVGNRHKSTTWLLTDGTIVESNTSQRPSGDVLVNTTRTAVDGSISNVETVQAADGRSYVRTAVRSADGDTGVVTITGSQSLYEEVHPATNPDPEAPSPTPGVRAPGRNEPAGIGTADRARPGRDDDPTGAPKLYVRADDLASDPYRRDAVGDPTTRVRPVQIKNRVNPPGPGEGGPPPSG